MIENEFVPGGDTADYSAVQGTETFTCLLNSMSSEAGVEAIDSEKRFGKPIGAKWLGQILQRY